MDTQKSITKFFAASAFFFIWVTLQGAIQAQQPVHQFLELGPAGIIVGAHVHIGTLGWIGMGMMGLFYYLVPKVSGKELSWPGLVNGIFWVDFIVVVLNGVLMIAAGVAGGRAVQAGLSGEAVNAAIGPYMMFIGIVSLLCGLVSLLYAVQIIHTLVKK
ncbi:MAG: hypothetical protein D6784_17675 [Chloroflexi bacterium]|nr:MAG: hypothetical protein D6784_17675 [Chloroflexota bacterium]